MSRTAQQGAYLHPLQTLGRRPVYLATFFVTLAANIGLSVAKTYWLPVLLRFVQAFGGASAIAVGAGTIAGITQRGERGTYMGYYSFAQYFGPTLGPVAGAALAQRWDYRARSLSF